MLPAVEAMEPVWVSICVFGFRVARSLDVWISGTGSLERGLWANKTDGAGEIEMMNEWRQGELYMQSD